MAINISSWDASEYLESEDDIAAYLNAALEDGNPESCRPPSGTLQKPGE